MTGRISEIPDSRSEVALLAPQERFVLWGMRIWMRGHWTGKPVDGILRKGFDGIYAVDALPAFGALMQAVTAFWLRPLDITCACRQFVTGDEMYLLDLIRLAHEREPDHFPLRLLDSYFRPDARAVLQCHLYEFLRELDFAITSSCRPMKPPPARYHFPVQPSVH